MAAVERLRFEVEGGGEVSALLLMPAKARRLLVLAQGAGAGMSHPLMEKLAGELAGTRRCFSMCGNWYRNVGTPTLDAPAVPTATVVAAVRAAAEVAPSLPLLAGGKSMFPSRGRRFAPSVMTGNKRLTRLFPGEWATIRPESGASSKLVLGPSAVATDSAKPTSAATPPTAHPTHPLSSPALATRAPAC